MIDFIRLLGAHKTLESKFYLDKLWILLWISARHLENAISTTVDSL